MTNQTSDVSSTDPARFTPSPLSSPMPFQPNPTTFSFSTTVNVLWMSYRILAVVTVMGYELMNTTLDHVLSGTSGLEAGRNVTYALAIGQSETTSKCRQKYRPAVFLILAHPWLGRLELTQHSLRQHCMQCSSCGGRGDRTPFNSTFLMDRIQSIPPGRGGRNFILSSCGAPHGSVGYYSLTIIIVRDSINFQTRRRLFFVMTLNSRDGAALP